MPPSWARTALANRSWWLLATIFGGLHALNFRFSPTFQIGDQRASRSLPHVSSIITKIIMFYKGHPPLSGQQASPVLLVKPLTEYSGQYALAELEGRIDIEQ
ncbi:hypothetical protein B0T25DRAFT_582872 [Lasiosphaeria hispida]|uniref:Uncharacterized protein n=1 Tax=Lasiosphaeria hispida TaxID=260671 RepID=A0AAJ0HG55_9PEZI|nr:hypothetical protein B0T25DRAFT_582872 [Lasiosphaeria hispida]